MLGAGRGCFVSATFGSLPHDMGPRAPCFVSCNGGCW